MAATGWLLDHQSGARRAARVEALGGSFVIHADGLAPQTINPMLLRPVEMQRGAEVYSLAGVEGWRLGLKTIKDPLIEARLPEMPKGKPPRDLTLWIGAAAFLAAFANAAAPLL